MSSGIQLIVGLGNPGTEYADTRHNAGAWFVDEIALQSRISLRANPKCHGQHAMALLDGNPCHLLIPTTFMNLSGRSVQALATYYKIAPHNILVAHDEIDLPVGTIKLKYDGGDGGHNGLRDIIRHLHTRHFWRLRIGVGRPANSKEVVDYVLHTPPKAERKQIDKTIEDAQAILPLIVEGHFQKAMHELHSDKDKEE